MATKYIPSNRDKVKYNQEAINTLKSKISTALKQYIKGRGAPKKIESATETVFEAIKYIMGMEEQPDVQTTVMTEGSSASNTIPPKSF